MNTFFSSDDMYTHRLFKELVEREYEKAHQRELEESIAAHDDAVTRKAQKTHLRRPYRWS